MAENSKIEWTHHTFNPWRGCTKVSTGCKNCYAETLSGRNPGTLGIWGPQGTRVVAAETQWKLPLRWNRAAKEAGERHRVFCASLADVFEGPDTMPTEVWDAVCRARVRLAELIRETHHLEWLLLTKRPQNLQWLVERMFGVDRVGWPDNFRAGVSIENQAAAEERLDELVAFDWPNFVSVEPLLGPIDLNRWIWPQAYASSAGRRGGPGGMTITAGKSPLDQIIVGGESGPGARPMNPNWPRAIRDLCRETDVPFLFKQWGEWAPISAIGAKRYIPMTTKEVKIIGGPLDGLVVPVGYFESGSDLISFEPTIDLLRVGKKAAGRSLDGVIHDGYPEPRSLKVAS